MKSYSIKFIAALIVFSLSVTSCTNDFEEINTNPNQTEKVDNPALLLPGIIRGSLNDSYNGAWNRGNIVADYLADQFVSQFDWSASDAEGYFLWTYYRHMRNVNTMYDLAVKSDLKNYQGVALVWKSLLFQQLTDIYGDIPYSEAAKAKSDGINFPKYDTQQKIYEGILADLETANTLLSPSNEALTGDILYNGDVMMWRRFANSLRLRCLLRISDRVDPTAEMTKMISNAAAYPIFENNSQQAALQYLDQVGNEFPRYNAQGFGAKASKTIVDILNGLNDPRLYVFAQATPATLGSSNQVFDGVPNGIANEATYNGGEQFQSNPGLLWIPTRVNAAIANKTAVQTLVLTYAEQQLTLAEAAERGFISGNAEELYLSGIDAHFQYYASRIPSGYTFPTAADVIPDASYYSQADVAYTGSQEEKLEKIHLQKWLSVYNCGFEGWSEWRRTGVPTITPGPASLGFIPVRFPYPFGEQRTNGANYEAAVAIQGADNTQTRIWWDVK